MDSETKKLKIQEIDAATGTDINNIPDACKLQKDLLMKQQILQFSLYNVDKDASIQFSDVLEKAIKKTKEINKKSLKCDAFHNEVKEYLKKYEPLKSELEKRYKVIDKFDGIIAYLKSYERVDELSMKLKETSNEEEAVHLFGELKTMALTYKLGHRSVYIKETLHYWHSILKENFSIQYEEVLKSMKWPITSSAENYNPPKEAMNKFNNLTKTLFLIQEPRDSSVDSLEQEPSLPIKFLLQPLKKRFIFHFMGSRETARIDRPEWFFTQTLTWIKDHNEFLNKNVQPIVDKLELDIKVENDFNSGLVLLASERLHIVLGQLLNANSPILDCDAAFAHTIDETLGFHNELVALTGMKSNSVLSVLTKAETLIHWLAVEKKYALSKIEECLSGNSWMEPVADSKGSAVGAELWVPRAADWFVSLLRTVEDRYVMLPQPGHRLQFLELQQELVEEWRIRLTQLLAASLASLHENTFSSEYSSSSNILPAVVNAAHHSRLVLLQWANSLHYLQLYYYQRQFEEFTQQQHSDNYPTKTNTHVKSVQEVEERAHTLAEQEATRRNSDSLEFDYRAAPSASEDGVWGVAPVLFMRLRDTGLDSLADHILLEFKASIKPYRRERWHCMPQVEQMSLRITWSLCRPLAGICSRLHTVTSRLAPALAVKLQAHVADQVDLFFFEEVVLTNYWNSGGIAQFKHDVERYLVPVFTTEHNSNPLPRLADACTVLDMDYEESRHLDDYISRYNDDRLLLLLHKRNVKMITPMEVQRLFEQRQDLGEGNNHIDYEIH